MRSVHPRILVLAIAVLALVAAPAFMSDYAAFNLDTVATFAIVAVGLGFFSGSTGQYSLGHAGFYAIGAFTAGLLATHLGWPFWLDVPAGGALAALAGVALGLPALRLSGPYVAIVTLGFGLLVADILGKADWAGGQAGLTLTPPLSNRGFAWVTLGVLVAGSLLVSNVRRGGSGRAFAALRQSEAGAQGCGIDVARYRIVAFALSAALAGVAGGLYANWAGYISAASFGLPLSIFFLAAIAIGGIDSTLGAIAGAVFLSLLRQALQDQPHVAEALYGAIVVAVLLFVPGGLAGLLHLARGRRMATAPLVETQHG